MIRISVANPLLWRVLDKVDSCILRRKSPVLTASKVNLSVNASKELSDLRLDQDVRRGEGCFWFHWRAIEKRMFPLPGILTGGLFRLRF